MFNDGESAVIVTGAGVKFKRDTFVNMPLSASAIRRAFDALSADLAETAERGEIVVVGGAALVLLFGARETTKDIDVYFLTPSAARMRAAASRVAASLDLPDGWLNDGAKGFLVGVTEGPVLYESESLVARAASTQQLLAMKLAAWRDAIDRADARLLLLRLNGTQDQIWQLVEPLVPQGHVDRAWYAFQDLWEAVHGTR